MLDWRESSGGPGPGMAGAGNDVNASNAISAFFACNASKAGRDCGVSDAPVDSLGVVGHPRVDCGGRKSADGLEPEPQRRVSLGRPLPFR